MKDSLLRSRQAARNVILGFGWKTRKLEQGRRSQTATAKVLSMHSQIGKTLGWDGEQVQGRLPHWSETQV